MKLKKMLYLAQEENVAFRTWVWKLHLLLFMNNRRRKKKKGIIPVVD